MAAHESISRGQFKDEHGLPALGTAPIPEGHVRLWHYTRDDRNLPRLRREGIRQDKAIGHTYGEPSMVWAAASNEPPKNIHERGYVEFHAHPSELDIGRWSTPEQLHSTRAHVTMQGSVPPERILAVHKPWHQTARYILGDPRTSQEYAPGGEFHGWRVGETQSDRGIRYAERRLGGKGRPKHFREYE
jgi:hypothetical protein